jgi:molybdopterin-guanine dinucleotide biosynthesis protein A
LSEIGKLENISNITGIIICGGKSSRMGREKGDCLLNSKPLIEYPLEVLSSVCRQVLLGTDKKNYRYLQLPMVLDEYKGIGPLGGIHACLKASSTTDNLIISCDMPLISKELVEYILSQNRDDDVVLPVFKGKPEPLCAYYNKRIVDGLENYIQKKMYKIQDVVKKFRTRLLIIDSSLDFYAEELFYNVNAPGDIDLLEIYIKNRTPE